ncbi:MAG: radical SAM protein [Thermoplasmatales archaeon]|nr:MAG: radical SAM protein [Thermoplasmatales archaeon]
MYNPIELSKKTEQIVVKDNLKKYYRFRPTRFYGGISTADTVGCNLRCKFCWSSNSVWNANNTGQFYTPDVVAEKLQSIADKKGYHQLRISGGEPTIGIQHLVELLEKIKSKYLFILETNGILLGFDEQFVDCLSYFENLHVRVCLKGADSEEFSFFTGANVGFEYQIKALQYLKEKQISFNIALVSVNTEKKQRLFQKLIELGLDRIMFEEEEIKLYPMVRKRLRNEGLLNVFE